MGFQHLYSKSNLKKIETIICNINNNTQLGDMIRVNLEWLQISIDSATPFLQNNKYIDYINPNWFTEIRYFLIKCNCKITIKTCGNHHYYNEEMLLLWIVFMIIHFHENINKSLTIGEFILKSIL
jgi:hypothetical protein